MTIWLKDDGTIEVLGHHNASQVLGIELEEISRRRVSEILPVNPILRFAFHLLRKTFGETGFVADWTRRWNCQWLVTSPLLSSEFQHEDRRVCERWEQIELERKDSL